MNIAGWRFLDTDGRFELESPDQTSYLYFPLANFAGMMASVTPLLHGDSKTSHNSFLLEPVSVEDLHRSKAARNFWIDIKGFGPWSATGNSARQTSLRFTADSKEETVRLEAGLLWHKIIRENRSMGLHAEVTNFVPVTEDAVELMRVRLTNTGSTTLSLTPIAAVPIYGRSAENLRDHRHVTSLLHRIATKPNGVEVKPTLSFDERGHKINTVVYGVYGADGLGRPPVGFYPVQEEFVGEGGCLDWPAAVLTQQENYVPAGEFREGNEALGGLRFADCQLEPGSSVSYILAMEVRDEAGESQAKRYCTDASFDKHLEENEIYWREKLDRLVVHTGDAQFDGWMRWVAIQPILRRIYGCSFLPHHDYGRGGRGWRDLWQDCLALLLMDPSDVRYLLLNNYAGVRIDGSNATIIGSKPGEFIADRNNISRVWMDHGAWPFLTTRLYLDQSGDLEFLFEEQTYFKDAQIHRSKAKDMNWTSEAGNCLRTKSGEVYRGTIIEHILLQHLTPFFNVGEHNHIKLEGADWNDALDMASNRGESVAFTALYAYNLMELANIIEELPKRINVKEVELAAEIMTLLDTLSEPVDYDSVQAKHDRLMAYYQSCPSTVTGQKVKIPAADLANDLRRKSQWMVEHIRTQEWISDDRGEHWFNGYYDDDGQRVEGAFEQGVRMTLTGQVFTVMGGVATDEQVKAVSQSVRRYLRDPRIGGYRLNTDFREVKLDLGRGFGFAFGHKENGAVFSHMAIMYANALYKRGFVREGYDVLHSLYALSADFEKSRIYPGVPEYINEKGRGMYHYLTGSASWYLLTVLHEVYGVKGVMGDLCLEPKLLKAQFDTEGKAEVQTLFHGRRIRVVYHNPAGLEYGDYSVRAVAYNGMKLEAASTENGVLLERIRIMAWDDTNEHRIDVELG